MYVFFFHFMSYGAADAHFLKMIKYHQALKPPGLLSFKGLNKWKNTADRSIQVNSFHSSNVNFAQNHSLKLE